jgi:hypothetical protein
MTKTFYFNTGVRPYIHNPPVKVGPGQIIKGGTLQIPFDCEDVPENAFFKFGCDDPNIRGGYLVRPILNSTLLSKFAYFSNL